MVLFYFKCYKTSMCNEKKNILQPYQFLHQKLKSVSNCIWMLHCSYIMTMFLFVTEMVWRTNPIGLSLIKH